MWVGEEEMGWGKEIRKGEKARWVGLVGVIVVCIR